MSTSASTRLSSGVDDLDHEQVSLATLVLERELNGPSGRGPTLQTLSLMGDDIRLAPIVNVNDDAGTAKVT